MRFQLSIIIIVFMLCIIVTKSTSEYKEISWNKEKKRWQVEFDFNGKKSKYLFENEVDAIRTRNRVHKNMGIPQPNPEICEILNQQKNKKTSQYRGVYWHRENGKWQVRICQKGQKQKYGGMFENELDAAKRVNQLCEEFGIPAQNPGISAMPNQQYQKKEKTSQYKGVWWHRENEKWNARTYLKEHKCKYGGQFTDELDAAKRVNQLCEQLGIPAHNPEISAIPDQQYQKKEKTSQYKGVCWHKKNRRWDVRIYPKGQKPMFGGYFKDELDAAKRVNQLCEKLGNPAQNPEISAMPNQQYKREKTSKYKSVYWHREHKKWDARICLKGQKPKFGGYFKDEVDAAKRVNQLCEQLGIPAQNSEISAIPNQQYQKKEKTSQYNGVYWHRKKGKWRVRIRPKGQKQECGGMFEDELDAAKKVNQLCEQFGIPAKNPEISAIPNQKYQEECKILHDDVALQAEFEDLIKILDENNDPAAVTIRETLITAIRYGKETKMTEINLQTKNGESALSIAAKHGFSNVVKFLISKGANKEHFNGQHHTPLSLAVTHNNLKVVENLLEEWISPNSHQEPYLHLSPIFNVKSREIAQLLVDNDAMTSGLYNNKNQSPLTVACQNGFLGVVEFFLDDGLDINHLDKDNKTPLFYAMKNKHYDVAHFLISKGAKNTFLTECCEQKQKALMSKC